MSAHTPRADDAGGFADRAFFQRMLDEEEARYPHVRRERRRFEFQTIAYAVILGRLATHNADHARGSHGGGSVKQCAKCIRQAQAHAQKTGRPVPGWAAVAKARSR